MRPCVCVVVTERESHNKWQLFDKLINLGYDPIFTLVDSNATSVLPPGITRTVCGVSYASVIDELRVHNPIAVIPIGESSVKHAECIAHALGLLGNDPVTVDCRRNKYRMHMQLASHGLAHIRQAKCSTREEVECFMLGNRDIREFVVKPADSAGSDDVFRCGFDVDDVWAHVSCVLGKDNRAGERNECALVQEFVPGKEYVVNMVARNGRVKVCNVWHNDKRAVNGGHFVYFTGTLLHAPDPLLIEYARKVMAAVGITHGAGHAEIIVRPDGQPCLVEIAARISGAEYDNRVCIESIGYDQMDATIATYCDQAAFDALSDMYHAKQHGMVVNLVSYTDAQVFADELFDVPLSHALQKRFFYRPGERLRKTVDLFTCLGRIELCGVDSDALEKEERSIRQWESSFFYV